MLEIGECLREARISSGVALKEASNDLNIKEAILENIESGSIGAFKNIYELKEYIQNYAKYLGLDSGKLLDLFNDYLFEYTSKIPIKEIEKKMVEQQKENKEEKVVSPYTKPMKKYSSRYYMIAYIGLILLAIGIVLWSIIQIAM